MKFVIQLPIQAKLYYHMLIALISIYIISQNQYAMSKRGKSPSSSFRSHKQTGQSIQSAISNMKKFTTSLKKNASNIQGPAKLYDEKQNQSIGPLSEKPMKSYEDESFWNIGDIQSPLTSSVNPSYHKRQIKTSSLLSSTQIPNNYAKNKVSEKCVSLEKKKRVNNKQNFKTEQVMLKSSIQSSSLLERRKNFKKVFEESQCSSPLRPTKIIETYQPYNESKQTPKQSKTSVDKKLLLSLYQQNCQLRQQQTEYKQLLLIVTRKYKQMESKMIEKTEADHLVDILKKKLGQMEGKTLEANTIIENQNEMLRAMKQRFNQMCCRVIEYYEPFRIEAMNLNYRQMIRNCATIQYQHQSPQKVLSSENIESTDYQIECCLDLEHFMSKYHRNRQQKQE